MVEERKETTLVENIVITRIPQTSLLLAGRHTGIGVWYTKLAVVVAGRMRVWFWLLFVYLP